MFKSKLFLQIFFSCLIATLATTLIVSAATTIGANISTAGTLSVTSTTATSTFSTGGLTVGGDQFVVEQTTGKIGIGTTTLGVYASGLTLVSDNNFGIYVDGQYGGTGNVGGIISYVTVPASKSDSVQYLSAGEFYLDNYATGNVEWETGVSSYVYHEGPGTATNAVGGDFYVASYDGTISNVYGVKTMVEVYGGTMTNIYGVYIRRSAVENGSVANNYGMYLENMAGIGATKNFQIYSEGTAPSYFAGKIGVGTTTPTKLLTVAGDIYATNSLFVGPAGTDAWGSVFPPVSTSSGSISSLTVATSTGSYSSIIGSFYVDGSAVPSQYLYGVSGEFVSGATSSANFIDGTGVYGFADHYGSGVVSGGIYGLQGWAYNESSVSPNANIYGLNAQGGNYGGTVKAVYGLYAEGYTNGNVNSAYGGRFNANKSSGTLSNAYSVYLDEATGAINNFNIYSAGASSKNFFEGKIGVGTTTPTTPLQVTTSTANATSTLTVGKANQNKGTCLELFDSSGAAVYAYVAAGATTFTLSAISCK